MDEIYERTSHLMIDPDGSDISEVDYIAGLNLKLRTNLDNTDIE